MDAVHREFCLFVLSAWHQQHLCMSMCIPKGHATYNKQLTSHAYYRVCAGKWLAGTGVHPPQGGGDRHLVTVPPRWGGGGSVYPGGGAGHGGGGYLLSGGFSYRCIYAALLFSFCALSCLPLVHTCTSPDSFGGGGGGLLNHDMSRYW